MDNSSTIIYVLRDIRKVLVVIAVILIRSIRDSQGNSITDVQQTLHTELGHVKNSFQG